MALIRGFMGHCPCPVCLIPRDKLRDHRVNYPARTSQDAIEYLERWERDRTAGEEALKAQSLRPVVVSGKNGHRRRYNDVTNTDES